MKKFILTIVLFLSIHVATKAQTYLASNTNSQSTAFNIDPGATQSSFTNRVNMMNTGSNVAAEKDAAYYFAKSKNQNTTGWVLAGTGAALICGALLIGGNKNDTNTGWNFGPSDNEIWKGLLAGVGTIFIITSVPCFITAGVNKRKANLALSTQKTGYGIPLNPKNIKGLTLSMPIGR
jgi:hypothetical protein